MNFASICTSGLRTIIEDKLSSLLVFLLGPRLSSVLERKWGKFELYWEMLTRERHWLGRNKNVLFGRYPFVCFSQAFAYWRVWLRSLPEYAAWHLDIASRLFACVDRPIEGVFLQCDCQFQLSALVILKMFVGSRYLEGKGEGKGRLRRLDVQLFKKKLRFCQLYTNYLRFFSFVDHCSIIQCGIQVGCYSSLLHLQLRLCIQCVPDTRPICFAKFWTGSS